MTTRYERMKMQRRMQRRIQSGGRGAAHVARPAGPHAEPAIDPEATVEIRAREIACAPSAVPAPLRAVGRVTVRSA